MFLHQDKRTIQIVQATISKNNNLIKQQYSCKYVFIAQLDLLDNKYKIIGMNPEYECDQIQFITNSLSANERYMLIFYQQDQEPVKELKELKPYVLVYENDDDKTIEELMEYYIRETNQPQIKQTLFWELQGGCPLMKHNKIIDIKKDLRRDNIDGLVVVAKVESIDFENLSFTNECAVQNYMEAEMLYNLMQIEVQYNKQVIEVAFHIPDVNYIIYLPITQKTQFPNVQNAICTEIKRIFGVDLKGSDFKLCLTTNHENKEATIVQIRSNLGSSSNERIIIQFLTKIELKAPPHQNNTYIIIKSDQFESKMFHYDDIKNKKVINVLSDLKQKVNWHQFGLLITENILRPFDSFSNLQSLCKNSSKHTKHLAALVIKQSDMFLLQARKLIQTKNMVDFEKENLLVTNESNQKHREDCEKKIRDRAKNADHQWFKDNLDNVKPVLLYTSELKVKGSDGKEQAIYRSLNTFLREQRFGMIQQKDYQKWKWENKFASQLLHQLWKIEKQQEKWLWRGVSYAPKHKIGDQVLYKQLNSSSTSKFQALKFAGKALYKILNPKSCRRIKNYSFYQSQDEVLFEPYMTLKILKMDKMINPQRQNIQIDYIQAQQIEKTELPEFKSLFILWVDDKTKEGRMMWDNLKQLQKTTVMIQLLSTEQLKKWLVKNKKVLDDPSVEIVMITNMTRVENGVKEEKAGLHALQIFKQYKPDSSIFFYIGWLEGTIAKLQQHNYELSDKLRVSKSQAQIRRFLNQIGIK